MPDNDNNGSPVIGGASQEPDPCICAACHKPIDDDDEFCRHCGHDRRAKCTACHKPIDRDNDFCRHCGHDRRAKPTDRDRQRRLYVIVALIALLALFALLAAFVFGRDDDDAGAAISKSSGSSATPVLQCAKPTAQSKTSKCVLKVDGHTITGNLVLAAGGAIVAPCAAPVSINPSVCTIQFPNISNTTNNNTNTTKSVSITIQVYPQVTVSTPPTTLLPTPSTTGGTPPGMTG